MVAQLTALPKLVDLHSHILPGIDDGAQTMADALALLQLAEQQGVVLQVLTPHIHFGRYNNDQARLAARFAELAQEVAYTDLTIQLRLAAEVRIDPQIMALVDADRLPWLGEYHGQKTFLLEFPSNAIPTGSMNLILWLRKQDILPVIAHPERHAIFQSQPDKLAPFVEVGCPLQITAASLLGNFGSAARQAAGKLLQQGLVDVIASDCHNLQYRPPNLRNGVASAGDIIGHAAAQRLAYAGPGALLGLSLDAENSLQAHNKQ